MTRLKLAELTSAVGALVLGVGLGALSCRSDRGSVGSPFATWDKHRLEASGQAQNPSWVVALYWVCRLLLAAVLAMLSFLRRR